MDDEVVEEVSTEAVVISVESPDAPPVEVIEAPAETDAVEAVVIDTAISHEGRIAALEIAVGAMQQELIVLEGRENGAQATADMALDIAIEAALEANEPKPEPEPAEPEPSTEPEESTDDDISPDSSRKHPMFRTYKEWKRR